MTSRPVIIRPLQSSDSRADFDFGNDDLNTFLKKYASQNQHRHYIGTTHVAFSPEENRVVGFATISGSEVSPAELPPDYASKVGAYPRLPALRLARWAVDKEWQNQGVGGQLMVLVNALAWEMAETIGCVGVVVDAKEGMVPTYTNLGFLSMTIIEGELGNRPVLTPMFISIKKIAKPKPPPAD